MFLLVPELNVAIRVFVARVSRPGFLLLGVLKYCESPSSEFISSCASISLQILRLRTVPFALLLRQRLDLMLGLQLTLRLALVEHLSQLLLLAPLQTLGLCILVGRDFGARRSDRCG